MVKELNLGYRTPNNQQQNPGEVQIVISDRFIPSKTPDYYVTQA